MLVVIALYAAILLASLRSRKAAGLATDPPLIVGLRIAAPGRCAGVVVVRSATRTAASRTSR